MIMTYIMNPTTIHTTILTYYMIFPLIVSIFVVINISHLIACYFQFLFLIQITISYNIVYYSLLLFVVPISTLLRYQLNPVESKIAILTLLFPPYSVTLIVQIYSTAI